MSEPAGWIISPHNKTPVGTYVSGRCSELSERTCRLDNFPTQQGASLRGILFLLKQDAFFNWLCRIDGKINYIVVKKSGTQVGSDGNKVSEKLCFEGAVS